MPVNPARKSVSYIFSLPQWTGYRRDTSIPCIIRTRKNTGWIVDASPNIKSSVVLQCNYADRIQNCQLLDIPQLAGNYGVVSNRISARNEIWASRTLIASHRPPVPSPDTHLVLINSILIGRIGDNTNRSSTQKHRGASAICRQCRICGFGNDI